MECLFIEHRGHILEDNSIRGTTTLHMIFSVNYYMGLHNAIFIIITIDIVLYQVKLLMLYNIQTTNFTRVDKLQCIH